MGERSALLDSDMYKISEEDSQDEEVLSSLRGLNIQSNNSGDWDRGRNEAAGTRNTPNLSSLFPMHPTKGRGIVSGVSGPKAETIEPYNHLYYPHIHPAHIRKILDLEERQQAKSLPLTTYLPTPGSRPSSTSYRPNFIPRPSVPPPVLPWNITNGSSPLRPQPLQSQMNPSFNQMIDPRLSFQVRPPPFLPPNLTKPPNAPMVPPKPQLLPIPIQRPSMRPSKLPSSIPQIRPPNLPTTHPPRPPIAQYGPKGISPLRPTVPLDKSLTQERSLGATPPRPQNSTAGKGEGFGWPSDSGSDSSTNSSSSVEELRRGQKRRRSYNQRLNNLNNNNYHQMNNNNNSLKESDGKVSDYSESESEEEEDLDSSGESGSEESEDRNGFYHTGNAEEENFSYFSASSDKEDHKENYEDEVDYEQDFFTGFLLITEQEIESLTNEEGNIFLVEQKSKDAQGQSSILPISPAESILKTQQSEMMNNLKNKKGGISRFLRRNSEKRGKKKEPLKKSKSLELERRARSNPSSPRGEKRKHGEGRGNGKPFRSKDEEEGEIRYVELSVEGWRRHGRRASLCESILGIIPGRFSDQNVTVTPQGSNDSWDGNSDKSGSRSQDDRIMIAGFIPDGPAIKSRGIRIGDWLRSIDDTSVNFWNIDSVLAAFVNHETNSHSSNSPTRPEFQSTVHVSLQRISGTWLNEEELDYERSIIHGKRFLDSEESESRARGREEFGRNELSTDVRSNLAILFISAVKGSENGPRAKEQIKDVVFSWPRDLRSNKKSKCLAGSQGMFSTLYRLLREVTGSHPFMSSVRIDDDVIEVIYSSDNEGASLFLFALSRDLRVRTNTTAVHLMQRIQSAILFKWGTLTRAFTEVNEDEISRFLSSTLESLKEPREFLFADLPSPIYVSPLTKMVIDEVLYSLEAAAFDSIDEGNVEVDEAHFHCLGSLVLYKKRLVSSHMDREVQGRFLSWMLTELNYWAINHDGLVGMKRVVIWQRVFGVGNLEESPHHYAVVVGLEHFLLGFILESAIEVQKFNNTHCCWIQHGLGALRWFLRRNIGSRIEKSVNQGELIQLLANQSHSEKVTQSKKGGKKLLSGRRKKNSAAAEDVRVVGEVQWPPKRQPRDDRSNLFRPLNSFLGSEMEGAPPGDVMDECEIDDQTAVPRPHARNSFKWNTYVGAGERRSSENDLFPSISVARGNFLFAFVDIDHGRGVVVGSKGDSDSHSVILANFRTTVITTHLTLTKAFNARKKLREQENDKKWVSRPMVPFTEVGTLFNTSSVTEKKKRSEKSSYWVLGRMYPDGRQVYVCYQDSPAFQNVVEIAFKLAHHPLT